MPVKRPAAGAAYAGIVRIQQLFNDPEASRSSAFSPTCWRWAGRVGTDSRPVDDAGAPREWVGTAFSRASFASSARACRSRVGLNDRAVIAPCSNARGSSGQASATSAKAGAQK
jgi:hypothetical protein